MGAQRRRLPGSDADRPVRWHFQHGPIDLVIVAEGDVAAVAVAHEAAWALFDGLLEALVAELPLLRRPVAADGVNPLRGPVARQMWAACVPLARGVPDRPGVFITPMAAVAGSVAQHLLQAYRQPGIRRAWINNGGDIALHLATGQNVQVGLVADLCALDEAALARTLAGQGHPDGRLTVHHDDPVRGIATSGWRGRSHSLGVADSVTVLAADAATADAAATVVANAVDSDAPGIQRRPASQLRDDSDLGDRLVTVAVPTLSLSQRQAALARGTATARALRAAGLLHAALLVCQGSLATVAPRQRLQCNRPLVQSLLHDSDTVRSPCPN
jgi:uncharacterized protein